MNTRPLSEKCYKSLLRQLFVEVSRARRIQLPVSLLIMQVDQIQDVLQQGEKTLAALMKALSKHIQRDIRVYDFLEIWPPSYMGLILPHTSERSAGRKAEQIRQTIYSSDFSHALPGLARLSLSIGLSEYPKVGRSADSLLESTMRACSYAAHEGGGNMSAVVTPARGFKPDFLVPHASSTLRDMV